MSLQLDSSDVIDLENAQVESRWKRAFQKLQANDSDLARVLVNKLGNPDKDEFATQIRAIVQRKLDDRDMGEWTIKLLGKKVAIREQAESLIRFVLSTKDIISQACNASPYASIAWSGVAAVLPLILRPSEQNEAMITGLARITDIVKLYCIRDTLYPDKQTGRWKDFGDAVVDLYSKILTYQAQIIHHLSQKAWKRFGSAVKKSLDWDSWLKDIQQIDEQCLKFADLFDLEKERDLTRKQIALTERSNEIQSKVLQIFSAFLDGLTDVRQDDFEKELMTTLAEGQSYEFEKNTRRKAVDGTCRWVLEVDAFRRWSCATSSALLWLSAGPGCGKSVQCRYLIDNHSLLENITTSHVSYFFFRDGQQNFTEGASAIRAVLHQIFRYHPERRSLTQHAKEEFRALGPELRSNLASLWKILMAVVGDQKSGTIICAIDALDECKIEQGNLLDLVVDYYELQNRQDQASNLKFLITSRRYDSIEDGFTRLKEVGNFIEIDSNLYSEQIERDVDKVLLHDIEKDFKGSAKVKGILRTFLQSVPNKTYLWQSLILGYLRETCKGGKAQQIEQALQSAPRSLHQAYNQILSARVANQRLAKQILMMVVAAWRPLSTTELNLALALADFDSLEKLKECDELEIHGEREIRSVIENACGQLVQVFDGKVYLLHQTLQEFLVRTKYRPDTVHAKQIGVRHSATTANENVRGDSTWKGAFAMSDAHAILAKATLNSRLFTQFHEAARNLTNHGFLYARIGEFYAGESWCFHYQRLSHESQESLLLACELVLLKEMDVTLLEPRTASFERAVMSAVSKGLVLLVKRWFNTHGFDLEKIRILHKKNATLLTLAAFNGHEDMVRMLLENDANVNGPVPYSSDTISPLQAAARSGRLGCLELLLDHDPDIDARGHWGPALHAAIEMKRPEIVRRLLQAGANVETTAWRTALMVAVSKKPCNLDIVKSLIRAGADVNFKNVEDESPLYLAIGDLEAMKLLLQAGAVIENASLVQAAYQGHVDDLKLLLEVGSHVDGIGGWNGTALQAASLQAHIDVVKFLIEAGADVNKTAGKHGTALQAAAFSGDCAVVQVLLDAGANINLTGGVYGHPLRAASLRGDARMVRYLIEAGADIDLSAGFDGTALQAALFTGNRDVVLVLLEYNASDEHLNAWDHEKYARMFPAVEVNVQESDSASFSDEESDQADSNSEDDPRGPESDIDQITSTEGSFQDNRPAEKGPKMVSLERSIPYDQAW